MPLGTIRTRDQESKGIPIYFIKSTKCYYPSDQTAKVGVFQNEGTKT